MKAPAWFLGSLASVVVPALLAGWATAQTAPGQASTAQVVKPAAIVNGEPIHLAEVDALLKTQTGPTPAPIPEEKRRQMRSEALTMLIDDLLLQQFLRQNGPRVEPTEVAKQWADLEEGLKKQGKTLQDFCRETGQTEAKLRADIVARLQLLAYGKEHIKDADIARFYQDNRDFFDVVLVRASHIVLRIAANSPEAERQAARNRLLALRQEIVAGRIDFAEAAKKNSQCPSAPEGGDIGVFRRKFDVDESFARAAFALKVGDVSDVVQSEYGLHLIKVTERKPGQPSEFEKIKDTVRQFCVEDLCQALLTRYRQASKIEKNLP